MDSLTPHSNHIYVIKRLMMSESVIGLSGSLFCPYGETDDVFLIGELVEPNETSIASAIRHCRRLVDYRLKPNHRPYSKNLIHGLVDHEPVKTYVYVIDLIYKDLRWRARNHTPRMTMQIVDHLNGIEASFVGQPGPLPPIEVPTNLIIQTTYESMDGY